MADPPTAEQIAGFVRRAQDINAPYGHTNYEKVWVHLQPYLEEKGYMLRPRYRPGWVGSWVGKQVDPQTCEDSTVQSIKKHSVMDATRIKDGVKVMLKIIRDTSREFTTHRFLTQEPLASDPSNHTVPILDNFPFMIPDSDLRHDWQIIVEPSLISSYWPAGEFKLLGDALTWTKQLLEGLAFMHSHNVAHRDIHSGNILSSPEDLVRTRQGSPNTRHIPIGFPSTYYFIDFGLSTRFPNFESRELVVFDGGMYSRYPELSDDKAALYDPFKADVYALSRMFSTTLLLRPALSFLSPLVDEMTIDDPKRRPTAEECVVLFRHLTQGVSRWDLLRPFNVSFRRGWRIGIRRWIKYVAALCQALVHGYGRTF